jgi:hypothetical protein
MARQRTSILRYSVRCLLIVVLAGFSATAGAQVGAARKLETRNRQADLTDLVRPSAKLKIIRAANELGKRSSSSSGRPDLRAIAASVVEREFPGLAGVGFEGALMLVMLSRLESLQADLESQVSDLQQRNQQRTAFGAYLEGLERENIFRQGKSKGAPPASPTPAPSAKTGGSSTGLDQTRDGGDKNARTPILHPKDPRRLSASELAEEILSAQAGLRALDQSIRADDRTLRVVRQQERQLVEGIDRIQKAQGDRLRSAIRDLR